MPVSSQSRVDNELYDSFRNFTRATIEKLAKIFEQTREIPVTSRYQFDLCDGKITRSSRVPQPSFEDFIERHQTEVTHQNQFRECIRQFEDSSIFQRHAHSSTGLTDLPKDEIEQHLKRNFLLLLLGKLLHSTGGFKFNGKDFDKLYDQMESYLLSDSVHFFSLAPINGFRYKEKGMTFEEDLKVSPIDSHRLTRLINSGLLDINMVGTPFPSHSLEVSFAVEKGTSINSQVPIPKFQEVLRAMRVFKRGVLGYDRVYCFPLSWEPTKAFSIFLSQPVSTGPEYILEQGEEDKLMRMYWQIKNLDRKKDRFLEIAIERFNYATQRWRIEDRLTDYVTVLEALFLGSEETAELGYRLSLRLATLLGESGDQRIEIRQVFSKAYAQRSKIVHGKKLKPIRIHGKKFPMEDLAFYLENHARNSLRIFLSLTTKEIAHKEFLDMLDDAIVDPEAKKQLTTGA